MLSLDSAGRSVGFSLTLVSLLVGQTARSQEAGVGTLTGVVVDGATKIPVAGVVVTATSPSLQGEQAVVTDSSGTYTISQLTPGAYTVRFEKETYKPFSRDAIQLDADRTLRFNVQLLPESIIGEQVVVVAQPHIIDVGSTQTGLTITSAFSRSVPISPADASNGGIRSFAGLALAAPSVSTDIAGLAIGGATSPENGYLIDGLSFSDPGFGVSNKAQGGGNIKTPTAGSDFSVEFLDEVNVLTGGYMPEYGRSTGGIVSLTTKSGGNEFHGSVFGTWTPGALAQTGKAIPNNTTIFASSAKVYNAWDVGGTLGGYIVKDKLWFFVGFNPSQYKKQVNRLVNLYSLDSAGNPILVNPDVPALGFRQTPQPSATKAYYQIQTNYSYIGKLTYLINSDNRLSFMVAGSPDRSSSPYTITNANADYPASGNAGSDNTIDLVLHLDSSFLEKKLLLKVTVGWHYQNTYVTALDGSYFNSAPSTDAAQPNVVWAPTTNVNQFPEDPAYNAPVTVNGVTQSLASYCTARPNACANGGYSQGGTNGILRTATEDRLQAGAVLTYFWNALGHQTWKLGLNIEWISYANQRGVSGLDSYTALSGSPTGPSLFIDSFGRGYLSGPDSVNYIPYVDQTSTALYPGAFIQDSWNIVDKVTLNIGVRWDSEYLFNPQGLAMTFTNEWSPRLGVIWDPTYEGKSKIYASYAIYYEAVPLDLVDRGLTSEEFVTAFHANCLNPALTRQLCSSSVQSLRAGASGAGSTGVGFGPNQYWFAYGADKEIIDPSITPERNDELSIGAEYEIFPNARLGVNYTHRSLSHLVEDFTLSSGANFNLGNPGFGLGSGYPLPARIYNAFTISLTKTLADHWQAQISYTYLSLKGNVEGSINTGYSQVDPNITVAYDFPQFLINAFGPLYQDIQSRIKAYGSYQFVFTPKVALTVGLAYLGQSGLPINAYGGGAFQYGPNTVFLIPRGSAGQLPWVHQLDVHTTLDFALGGAMRLSVGFDVFNVLALQTVTQVDESWVYPTNLVAVAEPGATLRHLKTYPLIAGAPGQITASGVPIPINTPYPTTGADSVLNPNWGKPTAYQSPLSTRLLARFTF